MTDRTDPRLLLLDPRDNVLVVRGRVRAGDSLIFGGVNLTAPRDLPLGHKLARCAIATGEKVVKYGAPIGSATAAIGAGEHVHTHNLASDYTPTYTLEAARAEHGEAS